MDIYVLMFRDGDQYGCSYPMSKKEADNMTREALENGIDVAAVELTHLFDTEKYVLCPVKSK